LFSYQKQGKTQTIAYYQCPEEAFDDETIMLSWAKAAYLVAIEAASSENKHKIKIV
jgi:TfoX/Sxy family transcriptional regulator of competence genes